jgi:hypothetical protein
VRTHPNQHASESNAAQYLYAEVKVLKLGLAIAVQSSEDSVLKLSGAA